MVITNFMNIKCIPKLLIRSLTIYSHMRCPCVCVLFVSSTSDIVFNREPVQCRLQPISEGGSPAFKFQLYMEYAGNLKPLLVLLNFLSNNITDHLLNKFMIFCCYENESGPIFKSPLTVNLKRFYHSNTTNLLIHIG